MTPDAPHPLQPLVDAARRAAVTIRDVLARAVRRLADWWQRYGEQVRRAVRAARRQQRQQQRLAVQLRRRDRRAARRRRVP